MKIYKVVFKDDTARYTNAPNLIKEEDIPKAMKYRGGIATLEYVGELINNEEFDNIKIPDAEPIKVLGKPITPDEVISSVNTYDTITAKRIIDRATDVEISEEQKEIMKNMKKALNTSGKSLKQYHMDHYDSNNRLRKSYNIYTGFVLIDDNDQYYLYDGNGHIHELISRPKQKNIIPLNKECIYIDVLTRKKFIYTGTYDLKEI